MKFRNSVLERVWLKLSFPAYFWKTAIRDSMHRSVSVGLEIFAFGEKKMQGSDKGWMLESTPENLLSSLRVKAVS